MSKKMKYFVSLGSVVIVFLMPLLYKHFDIPNETQNLVLAFIIGVFSKIGVEKAAAVRKKKVTPQPEAK